MIELGLDSPDTRYARSGDVSIAYQVVGDAEQDIVWIRGGINDMVSSWERPEFVERMVRLRRFARVLLFDKRGTGHSDHVRDLTSLEARMDDVRAVMDAAGSSHAILTAYLEGGRLALLFAATYPERVDALLLIDPYVRMLRSDEHPWGRPPEEWRAFVAEVSRRWGDRDFLQAMFRRNFPDSNDPEVEDWWVRSMRRGASPGAAAAWFRGITSADVTDVLPSVRVPVVVVRVLAPVDRIRYLTDRIIDSRVIDEEGAKVFPFGAAEETVLAQLEALASGVAAPAPVDRVLTTVLFTDIVDSTARAAALGDRAWADLIERHHALVRGELARHRGKEVDTSGDGFFATFDGPGRSIRCAEAIIDGLKALGVDVRAGIHTGECEVAAGKVAGIAVVVGARVAALAGPGEILATSTVKDLVAGSDVVFEELGEHELKGVPGSWRVFAVM